MPHESPDGDLDFPFVESPIYGNIAAPETLGELLTYLEEVSGSYTGFAGWRGQANIEWTMDSTAARRLLWHPENLPDWAWAHGSYEELPTQFPYQDEFQPLEKLMREYEKRLLQQARMNEHGFRHGRRLTDLELLSALQHYGAATRLMDFSRNVFVALWFACRDNQEGYGLLAGVEGNTAIHLTTEMQLDTSMPELMEELLPQEVGEARAEHFYVWQPRYLFERMRVQQSVFIFGEAIKMPWGSGPFILSEEGQSDLLLLAIPPKLKENMWEEDWRSLFGYDARSLFPDIEGFSDFHGPSRSIQREFFLH